MPHTTRRQLLGLFCTAPLLWEAGLARAAESVTAQAKHALVIGNARYLGKGRSLTNPEADANLVGQSLKKLGFEVAQHVNLTRSDFLKIVADYAERLPEGATSFVFYAGHGMQIGGANYLIPVDMQPNSEQSVQLTAYPLKNMLERLSASKSAVNIVALDACRNNPFQQDALVRLRSISQREGLATIPAPRGTLIAYSTAPGQLAADGKNSANSLYSAQLAQALVEPSLTLEQVFKKVGQRVRLQTTDNQIPWFESSLSDDVYLQDRA